MTPTAGTAWPGAFRVNCFVSNPSLQSSLKFLRRTPWARAKVEALYLEWATT